MSILERIKPKPARHAPTIDEQIALRRLVELFLRKQSLTKDTRKDGAQCNSNQR